MLHPRKLVIYSITSLSSGQGVAAVQLNKISEQVLERSAANMVCGSFGGSTGVAAVVSLAVLVTCQTSQGKRKDASAGQLLQVLYTYASSPWMVSLAFTRKKG